MEWQVAKSSDAQVAPPVAHGWRKSPFINNGLMSTCGMLQRYPDELRQPKDGEKQCGICLKKLRAKHAGQ